MSTFLACNTDLKVTLAFGGQSWPINPADMNLGTVSSGQCLGGIFDLSGGTKVGSSGSGAPNWVVGDTFLVCVSSWNPLWYRIVLTERRCVALNRKMSTRCSVRTPHPSVSPSSQMRPAGPQVQVPPLHHSLQRPHHKLLLFHPPMHQNRPTRPHLEQAHQAHLQRRHLLPEAHRQPPTVRTHPFLTCLRAATQRYAYVGSPRTSLPGFTGITGVLVSAVVVTSTLAGCLLL